MIITTLQNGKTVCLETKQDFINALESLNEIDLIRAFELLEKQQESIAFETYEELRKWRG